MNTILALLLSSAIVGFLIGQRYRAVALALVAPIIAVAIAITVRHSHFVLAVVIVFVSLLVNQIAYLIGVWLRYGSTTEQFDDRNSGDCEYSIGGEGSQHQNSPTHSTFQCWRHFVF